MDIKWKVYVYWIWNCVSGYGMRQKLCTGQTKREKQIHTHRKQTLCHTNQIISYTPKKKKNWKFIDVSQNGYLYQLVRIEQKKKRIHSVYYTHIHLYADTNTDIQYSSDYNYTPQALTHIVTQFEQQFNLKKRQQQRKKKLFLPTKFQIWFWSCCSFFLHSSVRCICVFIHLLVDWFWFWF